jgi:hypothetical protein
VQFLQRDAVVNVVPLEEAIDFVAGLEAKQLPQVRPGQTPGAISLGGQRFERLPCEVGAIGGETGGDLVREGDGQVHDHSLTEREWAVKSRMIKDVIMRDDPNSSRISAHLALRHLNAPVLQLCHSYRSLVFGMVMTMCRRLWLAVIFAAASALTGSRARAGALELSVQDAVYPGVANEYRLTLQGAARDTVSPIFENKTPTAIRFGNGPPLALVNCQQHPEPKEGPWACFDAADKTHRTIAIELHNVEAGKVKLVVSFGDGVSDELSTVLSPYGANVPRLVAIVATIITIATIMIILSRGPPQKLANGQMKKPLSLMIIDKGTCTYSLAKVQLYVWLLAAGAAYLYLFAAKVFAQGELVLVDVPASVATVALISITTTVVSTATNTLSGGKASGQFEVTPSDLITSGGDVAPERIQQLFWTLIAAPAFVVLAYMADPARLQDVQPVPDHFLQLMGISSAGFIGGKIARGPGPKITSVVAGLVSGPPPFLLLNIQGSAIQTKGATFTLRDITVAGQRAIPLPANFLPSSSIDASGIATSLDLSIPAAGLRQTATGGKWGYEFTILATDGEIAAWQF